MYDAEDRRRGADADRERQRGDGGEPGHAGELAQRIPRVLHELVNPFGTAHISLPSLANAAAGGVDSLDVAEATDGFRARELGVEAAGDVLARAHLDVERELRVDLVSDARLPDEGAQLAAEDALARHGVASGAIAAR